MKKLLIALILLMFSTATLADLTGTEGLAIDLSSAGAGTDFTIAFDPTEFLGSRTWGDGSTDTIVWTWNRATGTDPTITFNSGSFLFPALTLTTDLAVADGGTGASALTDGFVLLGSGTAAITPLDVTTDGLIIIGDGTTDPTTLDVGSSTGITILGTIATGVWNAGAVTSSGSITATTSFIGPLFDAAGAEDLDIGSVDVLDITLIEDGGTYIFDNGFSAVGEDLGSATAEWNDLFLNDGGVIYGQNDQSNSITSSATGWTFLLDVTVSGGNINTGNIPLVVGDATTDSIQLLTDGTGTAEVALPAGSIDGTEILDATVAFADIDNTPTLAGNPAFGAGESYFGTTGIIFEGSTADDIEGLLTVADPTSADKTWTLRDASGTVLLSGDTLTGDVTATFDTDGSTATAIAIDTIGTAEMADADHGDVAWSGGAASVQAMTITDATSGTYYVGMSAADTGVNQPVYTDGALTYAQATGTLAATEFSGGGASLTAVDAATGDSATDFFDAGEIADARISDTLTSSTCTGTAGVATLVTITDNEDTAENNPIVFVAGADPDGGNLGLETDGTTYYTPSTGTITATEFVGGGVGLTGVTAAHDGTITWSGTAVLESGVAFQFGDATDATLTHTYANTGTNVSIAYSTAAMAVTGALTATNLSGTNTGDNTDAETGDSATAFFDAGTIEHEYGGLQADVSGWTGLFGITGADTTVEVDTFTELDTAIADKALVNKADGAVWLGTHDFGGADLELPQASPAVPGVDGGIEIDFTDGSVVIQHGSAHAELGASTDVVVAKLIRSFSGTIFAPDGVNDVMTVKAINSIEYPHGIVITACYLGVSENSNYTLTVQNFDDFDTINAGNGTIDAVAYTADTTGEVIDTSPTYATIAAGQIIMVSIPATDVDWIHFEIYYYEPAA